MGATHPIQLHTSQQSVAEPGTLCVTTSSFDDLDPPLSLANIFDSMELFMRQPVIAGSRQFSKTKYVDVQDHGPHDFTVRVVMNGVKLDAAGDGRGDGCDKITIWKHCSVDRTSQTFLTKDFVDVWTGGSWADQVDSNPSVVMRTRFHWLVAPPRIEICCDECDGLQQARRMSRQDMAERLYLHGDIIIKMSLADAGSAVKVTHGAPSIKEPGALSNVSTPLKGVDREQVFDAMAAELKEMRSNSCSAQVVEASVSRFVMLCVRPDMHDERMRVQADLMRDSGEIHVNEVAVTDDGDIAFPPFSRSWCMAIHQDPVVVESWDINQNGERTSTLRAAKALQKWMNDAIGDLVSS